MTTIIHVTNGRVTGLWGSALIRGTDGKMHPLHVGDPVKKGDMILTTQDGIVQITPEASDTRLVAPAQPTEIDRVISELNQDDTRAATAAGLNGGDGGEFQPGLRVGRIVETVTPAGLALGPLERSVVFDVGGTTAPENLLPTPDINAISSAISAVEEGPNVNLGLAQPVTVPPAALVTANAVPIIGQVQKADGTVVTAGSVISAADLPGLLYVPPADYNGTAVVGNFVYTVTNGTASATGTATISVTPINDAPVATPGSVVGLEDATLPIALTGQDVDGTVRSVTDRKSVV